MVANHTFKSEWFYNVLLTPKFIDVMKNKNNTSIYELLGQNNFPVKGFFYLALSYNDTYQSLNEINLKIHRPRYRCFIII